MVAGDRLDARKGGQFPRRRYADLSGMDDPGWQETCCTASNRQLHSYLNLLRAAAEGSMVAKVYIPFPLYQHARKLSRRPLFALIHFPFVWPI